MITNEMKSEIKKLWNALWSGGIANPLNAMEQISYFLYMRRLSVMDEEARQKAEFTGESFSSVFEGIPIAVGTTSSILTVKQCWFTFEMLCSLGSSPIWLQRVTCLLKP